MQYKIPDDGGTSPTQGEKPAEARTVVIPKSMADQIVEELRARINGFKQAWPSPPINDAIQHCETLIAALSSPQEGATAACGGAQSDVTQDREATEGRPAEARALLADTRRLYDGYNLRELLAWRDEVCRYLSALLSPQEGATEETRE